MCADDLAAVLPYNDVVLSVLGTRGLAATSVLADGVHATIEAMRRASVRRLVIVSSSLLDSNLGWVSRFAGRTILRHHVNDQLAMEKQVTASGLDWTVLRSSRFSKGGLTGRYVVTAESEQTAAEGAPMSRENVAHMMLDTAERNNHVKEIVRISGQCS
jgi:putative NADH-flavin reductase